MQITLKNLKRDYGSLHAVDGVSLEIPSNTVYGIIGRSGAGKSTLVRLVSMLETPDQGEVWYGDKRVDNLSREEMIQERRKIGMIFQNFNLFSSRTAAGNIAYPMEICRKSKEYIRKRTEELLALVPERKRQALRGVLAQDPRPSYQEDPQRVYGMTFGGLEVKFRVEGDRLTVCQVEPAPEREKGYF